MQTPILISPWLRLRNREISYETAIALLLDPEGNLNLDLLDSEVSQRFFRNFPDRNLLPPVVPLLLWRGCYYLGSPVAVEKDLLRDMSDRTLTEIQILPISDKSYTSWYHTTNLNPNRISSTPLVNPLTG